MIRFLFSKFMLLWAWAVKKPICLITMWQYFFLSAPVTLFYLLYQLWVCLFSKQNIGLQSPTFLHCMNILGEDCIKLKQVLINKDNAGFPLSIYLPNYLKSEVANFLDSIKIWSLKHLFPCLWQISAQVNQDLLVCNWMWCSWSARIFYHDPSVKKCTHSFLIFLAKTKQ